MRAILLTATMLLALPLSGLIAKPSPKKPNIIFILADDQGWNGLSVQMHPDMPDSKSDYYRTPNIEKLAKGGLIFSRAYAPGPMCSPTRASLQTGKSPAQLGMTNVGGGRQRSAPASQKLILPTHTSTLSTDETTIGEVLQRAGYATAWFGKWHLGQAGPGEHGYDEHDGATGNENGNVEDPNPKDIFGITERGSAFMEKQVKASQPFYLQLWHYAVHGAVLCLEETEEAYAARPKGKNHINPAYAAMTENLDTGVGMIMKKVEELGIADNTYIVYMSDHGAPLNLSSNLPLAQGKGTLWEGGLRVPLIISGPGVKAGSYCQTPTVGWDLFPTFCELAGVDETLPKGLEGGSLKPLFASGKGKVDRLRKEIAFHFPHYGQGGRGKVPHSTILLADYKLIKLYEDDELHLFNLKEDIGEQNDLSKKMPEKVATMHRRLNDYLEEVSTGLPTLNPDYDPSAPVQASRRSRGGRRQGQTAGEGDTGTDSGRGPQLSQQLTEWLGDFEKAYEQDQREKMGELLADMKQKIEDTPPRPDRSAPANQRQAESGQDQQSPRGPGANRPGGGRRQQIQSEFVNIETAYNDNDHKLLGEQIAKIKQTLENAPARPGGRGSAGQGRGAGRQGPGGQGRGAGRPGPGGQEPGAGRGGPGAQGQGAGRPGQGGGGRGQGSTNPIDPQAKLEVIADTFEFTEGPALDADGNIFFSDVRAAKIYKFSPDGKLSVYRENTGGANGLYFGNDGNLFACQGDNARVVSIAPNGKLTVIADKYNGKGFNRPNDLWLDPKGGVYFTDPASRKSPARQDGGHVYYVTPDRKKVIRVINDMERPNGIIGTPDGKTLYVADPGAEQVYVYNINPDGTLTNKKLLAPVGSDGMTLDRRGNIYITWENVLIYNQAGEKIGEIQTPQRPTNVTFGGKEGRTLFITARTAFYSIKMRTKGASTPPPENNQRRN